MKFSIPQRTFPNEVFHDEFEPMITQNLLILKFGLSSRNSQSMVDEFIFLG